MTRKPTDARAAAGKRTGDRQPRGALVVLSAVLVLAAPRFSAARQPQTKPPAPTPSTLSDTLQAGEAETDAPRRKLVRWNEYEGSFFTIRMGGAALYDYASYSQDDASAQQFDLTPQGKFRDARFLLTGRFKFKRSVTWTAGIMYDGPTGDFLFRETGIMVAVPEIWGHLFIGRTKEGFSLNKVMSGYAGWTMERATINDATIPILADGVKWLGYTPKLGLLWNLGVFGDWLSKGQSFSIYAHQVSGRVAWLPVISEHTVLHIGMSARYGKPVDGALKLRSRPEVFLAPYFVDTGEFAAQSTKMLGGEFYYRPGSFLFGSEYAVQRANAPQSDDPWFHGGDAVVSWLPTGERRGYNTRGGYFSQISPLRTVFSGGPGAWELLGRFSYIDLDGGSVRGGRFWRFTPMVNWYLSDHMRLEFAYGVGRLDRFQLTGTTQFLQSRLQLQF